MFVPPAPYEVDWTITFQTSRKLKNRRFCAEFLETAAFEILWKKRKIRIDKRAEIDYNMNANMFAAS